MTRAVVLMLDSLGIGASADADRFGDDGADTFGHIAMACARGDADRPVELGERQGFADMGQTLASHFGLNPLNNGTSFLKQITLESPS